MLGTLIQHSEGPSRATWASYSSSSSVAALVLCGALPAEQSTPLCVECRANGGRLLLIPQLGYLKPGDVQILNTQLFCVSNSFLCTVGHSWIAALYGHRYEENLNWNQVQLWLSLFQQVFYLAHFEFLDICQTEQTILFPSTAKYCVCSRYGNNRA